MMAHAPLLRTNTAPVFQASTDGVARLQNSMSIASAPRASQLSGTTAFPSTSSLHSFSSAATTAATPPPHPPANGQVVATSNIINQKADASRSLYQMCVALRQRLAQVPDFGPYLAQLEAWAAQDDGEEGGPVESLWRLLRTGHPLLTIYNALRPEKPLRVDESVGNEAKRSKIAIANFVRACLNDLKPPPPECFIINDLTGNDTTGFVKVIAVINHVLDLAERRNLLLQVQTSPENDPSASGSQMSYRDYIIRELVDTERKYVQDLENLHDLKKTLEERGVIPGDIVHQIFLNINAILDFQRRFLIRVETTNSMPPARQEWGSPFVFYEDAFSIYQPFIANQRKAEQIASQVFDKIQAADHPVACDFNTLDGFLLKPMQRLVKYPLLLKDLLKKSEDEHTKSDLTAGINAAERVLQKANEAVDRDLLDDALDDLISRVDDWKSHRVEQFGKLLLHGIYTVVTGKSDQEKDYEIYLFECILLCCKEVSPNKSKDKKDKTKSTGPKIRNKNTKLQLKGRIFMTNVTDVVAMSKTGSYTVQIWWKGDPGVENFTIKFQNEETMRKWAAGLDQQRKENAPQSTQSPDRAPTNFAWLQTQVSGLENPYAQQDEDEDDEPPYGIAPAASPYGMLPPQPPPQQPPVAAPPPPQAMPGTMPRNPSNTSLRSRSATAESAQSLAGVVAARGPPPPRFPLPQPPPVPLSLQTQMSPPGQQSPNPQLPNNANSYFSPTAESPVSSRTSTTSGYFAGNAYPFPQTGTPHPTGWEDYNRYTAPAMPRDGPSPANAYGMVTANGRNPRGPSLPVMTSQTAAQLQQQRSRSYSTPDINGQPMNVRRQTGGASGGTVPAVPGIPPHLHHPAHERHDSTIPRSNTGSPRNDLPIRTNTQSPGTQRERERQYGGGGGGGGGSMAKFPAQPVYARQGGGVGVAPPPAAGVISPPPSGPVPPVPGGGGGGMSPPPLQNDTGSRTMSPALGGGGGTLAHQKQQQQQQQQESFASSGSDLLLPTQLKVKVNCNGNYVTLVVAFNITYQSLIDRIDAKLNRFTNASLGKGNLKLRYQDEDGDFVTIESDDDIQIAISEWREGMRGTVAGSVGEIELFCVGETS